jgi:hypothetical protein
MVAERGSVLGMPQGGKFGGQALDLLEGSASRLADGS